MRPLRGLGACKVHPSPVGILSDSCYLDVRPLARVLHHPGGTHRDPSPAAHDRSEQAAEPICDKPMIYPLSTLMVARITDLLVITTSADARNSSSSCSVTAPVGISITCAEQPILSGLRKRRDIGRNIIGTDSVGLVFRGSGGTRLLGRSRSRSAPRPVARPLNQLLGEPLHFSRKPSSSKACTSGLRRSRETGSRRSRHAEWRSS